MTMREQVARALHDDDSRRYRIHSSVTWDVRSERIRAVYLHRADLTITACLSALAAEASQLDNSIRLPDGDWSDVESWIVDHMPSQPEVRDV